MPTAAGSKHVGLRAGMSGASSSGKYAGFSVAYGRSGWKVRLIIIIYYYLVLFRVGLISTRLYLENAITTFTTILFSLSLSLSLFRLDMGHLVR